MDGEKRRVRKKSNIKFSEDEIGNLKLKQKLQKKQISNFHQDISITIRSSLAKNNKNSL